MHDRKKLNRLTSLLLVAFLFAPATGWAAARADNVILLIGDGFGPQHFGAAWLYSNRVLGKRMRMTELMEVGRTGYIVNDTADATVTESAAAASQMATGIRAKVRTLSMSPDPAPFGQPLETILEIAQARGMATGLVTTSGITDATPGAFAAHVLNRSAEDQVADQELQHRVDVLMGGRKEFFIPQSMAGSKRKDERNLMTEASQAGYAVVEDAQSLAQVRGQKVLGLFSFGNMAFELDRATTQQPSLAQMTSKALELLSQKPGGFFAMIEGGRIDHASHGNDATAAIKDSLAFDDAVGVALDFQRTHPNTLLIVTSDHETGGMGLIGHSKESVLSGNYEGINFEAFSGVKMSMEQLMKKMGTPGSSVAIQAAVRDGLGVELTPAEAQTVFDDTIKKLDPANYHSPYVHSLAFVLRPYLRVGFSSQTHTASPIFAYGIGPGSEKLVGFHHNTELFTMMKTSMLLGSEQRTMRLVH